MKKILFLPIFLVTLSGCSQGDYTSEVTYTIPAVEAKEAVTETAKPIEINASGNYPIGTDFSLNGNEKEFTTGQSGKYKIGDDIPAGVYNLEATQGTGTIETGDNYIMMGVGNPEYYEPTYKNIVLYDGNDIETSGVSIKFSPATDDKDIIPSGTYNVEATNGKGTIQNSDIYEMIGVGDPEYYVPGYDNLDLLEQTILNVEGVKIKLTPQEENIVIEEAVEAQEAYDITEKIVVDSEDNESCYQNDDEVACNALEKREELENDISEQKK